MSEVDILIRAAQGDPGAREQAVDAILAGLAAWHRDGGKLDLGRYLGLGGARDFRQAERDCCLRGAHSLMAGPTAWHRSVELTERLAAFRSRIWPAWRHEASPPGGCSGVHSLLFHAMRAAERMRPGGHPAMPNTARRIHDIVKQSGREIS